MDGFNLKTKSFKTPRRFLCCFGFPTDQKRPDKIPAARPSNKRKRFQFNSPSSAKTVPVDAERVQQNNNSSTPLRPSKKSKFKWTTKSNSNASLESIQESPRHQNPTTPSRTQPDSDRTPASENGKRSDSDVVSCKDDGSCASKRLSFRWRIDSIRTGNNNNNSLPGSPKVASPKPKPKPSRTVSMPSSVSFLPEPKPEPQPVAVENKPAVARVARKKRKSANARKIDPIVGMSIIAVTLVIMLLWGRLCAILCTSAWFYFVPRLRDVVASSQAAVVEKSGASAAGAAVAVPAGPDFDSEEHKKKVVLEGLLKRNHRSFS